MNCTAYDVQGDDQLILSHFPDAVWTFGLYRSAWKLDTNQTYYLWYNVDGPADAPGVTKRPVEAQEPTRIFFEISDVEDIVARIENGKVLNVEVRGVTGPVESYSYPLDHAHEAFEATRKCVSDHAAASSSAASAGDTHSQEGSGVAKEESMAGDSTETVEETAGSNVASGPRYELPPLGSKVIETMDVPGWDAAAFSGDDGTFTHCGIEAEYQNGATLGVARAVNGDLMLAVQYGDWSLTEGEWVPMSYTFGGDGPIEAAQDGKVVSSNAILTLLGATDAMAPAVAAAPAVSVSAEGTDLSFDISDIGPGIAAINECVARHMAAPSPTPAAKTPAAKKVGASPVPDSRDVVRD